MILLDILMPIMSGMEMLEEIKKNKEWEILCGYLHIRKGNMDLRYFSGNKVTLIFTINNLQHALTCHASAVAGGNPGPLRACSPGRGAKDSDAPATDTPPTVAAKKYSVTFSERPRLTWETSKAVSTAQSGSATPNL